MRPLFKSLIAGLLAFVLLLLVCGQSSFAKADSHNPYAIEMVYINDHQVIEVPTVSKPVYSFSKNESTKGHKPEVNARANGPPSKTIYPLLDNRIRADS